MKDTARHTRFASRLAKVPAKMVSCAVCVAITVLALPACAPPLMIANAGMSLAEAGTSAFIEGELRSARKCTIELAAAAYEQAVIRLGFMINRTLREKDYVYISADQLRGEDIEIRLVQNTPIVTSIRIRVGVLGDQAIARLIMEEAQLLLNSPLEHRTNEKPVQPQPQQTQQGDGTTK
jgi:hypothetical protein